MTHDKRDEAGMYRPLSSAEVRHQRAREETQTHEGRFTHTREAADRRTALGATVPQSTPYFKNKRFNRDPYMPKGIT